MRTEKAWWNLRREAQKKRYVKVFFSSNLDELSSSKQNFLANGRLKATWYGIPPHRRLLIRSYTYKVVSDEAFRLDASAI